MAPTGSSAGLATLADTVKIESHHSARTVAFAISVLSVSALLVGVILYRFVIGTLADDRVTVTRDLLQAPVSYFPDSARLNARLASAELSEANRDLASAKAHAQRAVNLSPMTTA